MVSELTERLNPCVPEIGHFFFLHDHSRRVPGPCFFFLIRDKSGCVFFCSSARNFFSSPSQIGFFVEFLERQAAQKHNFAPLPYMCSLVVCDHRESARLSGRHQHGPLWYTQATSKEHDGRGSSTPKSVPLEILPYIFLFLQSDFVFCIPRPSGCCPFGLLKQQKRCRWRLVYT